MVREQNISWNLYCRRNCNAHALGSFKRILIYFIFSFTTDENEKWVLTSIPLQIIGVIKDKNYPFEMFKYGLDLNKQNKDWDVYLHSPCKQYQTQSLWELLYFSDHHQWFWGIQAPVFLNFCFCTDPN